MTCLRSRPISIQSEPGLIVSTTDFSGSSCSRIWSKYATCTFAPSRIVPASGSSWPRISLISVDLPAPFGPISPRRSPRCRRIDRSFTTGARRSSCATFISSATSLPERSPASSVSLTLPEALASRCAFDRAALRGGARGLRCACGAPRCRADPDFFLRPELVELAIGDLLGRELLALARFVGGEVAGKGAQQAAIELDDARHDAIEERAIVRDHDDVGPFSSSSSSAVMPSMSR